MRMGRVDRVSKLIVIILSLMLAVPFMTFFSSEEASAGEVLSDIAGATYAHSKGYDGTGILIGEVGTGLDTGDNATLFGDFAGRVEHFVDWAEVNDADGVAEDAFGMSTPFVSWMAGDDSTGQFDPVDGKLYGLGMAPGASIMTERIFDDTGTPAAVNIADVFTDACQRGAYAMTNSWGGGANYEYGSISNLIDTATRDADTAAPGDQPLLLFMASGNTDIMESGCSKNGITVGVSEGYKPHKGPDADNIEELWTSSPSGPTADGRIKPDIVAPATWGAGARSHDPGAAGFTGWEAVNADYLYTAGSGGSSAVGCGGAAVFAQYYNDINGALPSPAMTKAAMINGATDMDTADIPNSNEGWGRLNLTNMIDPGFDIFYDDQNILLETGGSQIYDSLNVNDASQPLKITVVWTDVPAPPTTGTGAALINDLDLTAISPGGQVYYGNFFVGGWAVPDIPIVDTVNNEECVYVQTPELGLWTIYVNGTDVQQDAISATGEIDQDYAFIISGSFDIGGGPVVDYGYADPNPTNGAATTTVYAGFSDSQNIADAEYFIDVTGDNGTGTAMTPSDGAFDEPDEDAYADLDIGALGWLPGETHTIYVHAQDSNTEWGSFFPITIFVGTQYFLHVENSIGVDMSLWTTAPDEVAIITNTTGPMPTAGDYQVGTQAWITDPLAADTDVSGTWRFFMNGYVTTDEAAGFLYAKVYEHSTMTLLNPAPEQCPTNISGTYSYYEFEWT
ncbi:MAG: S8 family serine peptidase, partial [Thermoplasmata archaeon]|nr:S8 family serine peptidase [Thermoplasmata archaeon]